MYIPLTELGKGHKQESLEKKRAHISFAVVPFFFCSLLPVERHIYSRIGVEGRKKTTLPVRLLCTSLTPNIVLTTHKSKWVFANFWIEFLSRPGPVKAQRSKSDCMKGHWLLSQHALEWTSPYEAELGCRALLG